MKRPAVAIAVALVGSGWVADTSAAAVDPVAAVAAFQEWATGLGTPVEDPACNVTGTITTCYGLLLADPNASDFSGVLVGVAIDATFEFIQIQSFPAGDPAGAAPAAGPATTFGDGTWIVGTDVTPGAYRAPGGSLCYWARLADFSGEDIITNAFSDTSSQMLVEIEASDVAFETTGCGTWEPVG